MSFSAQSSEYGNQGKGEKRGVDEAELEKVHSANDWEKANLGDDDRRNKFLRLMGAKKTEHHGRFVIGENSAKHGRTDEETSRLNRQLEHQYRSGLDLKLSGAARHHSGLGFQNEKNAATCSTSSTEQSVPPAAPPAEPCANKDPASDSKDPASHNTKPETTDSHIPHHKDSQGDKPADTTTQDAQSTTNGKDRRSSQSEKFKMNFVKASD